MFLPSLVIHRDFFPSPSAKIGSYSLMLILLYSSYSQSTRVEFDLPEYSVRRRYQDFDWLRNKLEESQPTHLIPVGTKSLKLITHFPAFSSLRLFTQLSPLQLWANSALHFRLVPPSNVYGYCVNIYYPLGLGFSFAIEYAGFLSGMG